MAFGFLKNVVKVSGKVTLAPIKLKANIVTSVGKKVGKVPVVGKPLKAAINITNAPAKLAASVGSGERIDQAVIKNIKQQVKDIKTVAPYAKMVVTLVPGVGTGLGAAISAGCALAEGQSITSAFVEGIRGAVPGGALGQSVFNIAGNVANGGSLQSNLVAALPLTATQKTALTKVVNLGKDVASGKKIDTIVVNQLQNQLPPDVRKAINIGLAVGKAQQLQKSQVKNIPQSDLTKLATIGVDAINKNAVLKTGYGKITNSDQKKGFAIAIGLMEHTATANEISSIQSKLPNQNQKTGFATGLAARVGLAATIKPVAKVTVPVRQGNKPTTKTVAIPVKKPVTTTVKTTAAQNNAQAFGQAVAHGLAGASIELKTDVVKAVASDPQVMAGVTTVAKAKSGWLHKLLVALHLVSEPKA